MLSASCEKPREGLGYEDCTAVMTFVVPGFSTEQIQRMATVCVIESVVSKDELVTSALVARSCRRRARGLVVVADKA